MTTLLAFVFVFGTIVFFHELGHFTMAKLAGIAVYEFSLGFGPAAWSFKHRDTKYSIRWLPLGGFVKMAGMDEDPEREETLDEKDPRSFANKSVGWRMGVIAAGPAMNFISAVIIFAIYFTMVVVPPTIGRIEVDSPAYRAGLLPGDVFIAMQGTEVDSIEDVIASIDAHAGQELLVTIRRGPEILEIATLPAIVDAEGRLGIEIQEKPQLPVGQSLTAAVLQTGHMTGELVRSIRDMIRGVIAPDIAGPIGIVHIVGETASYGFSNLLLLMALFNINLGLLNLLPIPVLDGGWLVMLAIEGIRGRPIDPRYRGIASMIGMALLLLLMLFATLQDILRLNWFS